MSVNSDQHERFAEPAAEIVIVGKAKLALKKMSPWSVLVQHVPEEKFRPAKQEACEEASSKKEDASSKKETSLAALPLRSGRNKSFVIVEESGGESARYLEAASSPFLRQVSMVRQVSSAKPALEDSNEAVSSYRAQTKKSFAENRQSMPSNGHPEDLATSNAFSMHTEGESEAPPPKSAPAEEDLWAVAFDKLQEDNELHLDALLHALELLGFVQPNQQWIDEVARRISSYSTLSLQEFMSFVEIYKKHQRQSRAEAFAACDKDGSGEVDADEFAELLLSFGIEPMKHVVQEVFAEADKEGAGQLGIAEFEEAMELLATRQAFSKNEYEDFLNLFYRFDRDSSGMIDTTELAAALNWLGFAWDKAKVQELMAMHSLGKSGSITEREFMMCMRKVQDSEVSCMKAAMHSHPSFREDDMSISSDDLFSIFRAVGFEFPEPTAVMEALEEVEFGSHSRLDLGEVWIVLTAFRQKDSFSNADMDMLQRAFEKFDTDRRGELSTLDVGRLLRSIGWVVSFEQQQKMVTKVDVDDSGMLEISELRKMIRMLVEMDVVSLREAFRFYRDSNFISTPNAVRALEDFSYNDISPAMFSPTTVAPDGTVMVDERTFILTGLAASKKARSVFAKNGGFTQIEVDGFRRHFSKYAINGFVGNSGLVSLLQEIIPSIATNRELRPQLLEMMSEAELQVEEASMSRKGGTLDFTAFLCLMKSANELEDAERVGKEIAAIQETGFTTQEVTDFRDLFIRGSDLHPGALSFQELVAMIDKVSLLGQALKERLFKIFNEVIPGPDDEEKLADFPGYLKIMRILLDCDFARITEKSQIVLAAMSSTSKKRPALRPMGTGTTHADD